MSFLTNAYLLLITLLAVYGYVGLITIFLFIRHRHDVIDAPPVDEADLPSVTVQLPIYNEQYVVERLLASITALDYPRHLLQIQVVDDSTDATSDVVAALVASYAAQGFDMMHCTRNDRVGFKAGGLQAALPSATGEFVAMFDADFCPQPDFLRQTVPHLMADDNVGMVQVRWGHLNAHESPLTLMQAIALDKHFAFDQPVRHRADLFLKFNGSGGIWRRAAIDDAGGWEFDTVTEDLCLSTRAKLRGWHFIFLSDVVAPAELPNTIAAFRNQQSRWAKGSFQCFIKYFWRVWFEGNERLVARFWALLSMSAYSTHVMAISVLLLRVPLMALDVTVETNPWFFTFASIGQPVLFVWAQMLLHDDWRRRVRHLPASLIIVLGLGASQARAMLEVVFGRMFPKQITHQFVRTPKGQIGQRVYMLPFDWIVLVELFFATYALVGVVLAVATQRYGSLLHFGSCAAGYGYVAYLSLKERRFSRKNRGFLEKVDIFG